MKDAVKPGWRTSEFWITLTVLIVAAIASSGAVGEESGFGKLLLGVLALAQTLGYTAGRAFVKNAGAKAVVGDALGKALTSALEPKTGA